MLLVVKAAEAGQQESCGGGLEISHRQAYTEG